VSQIAFMAPGRTVPRNELPVLRTLLRARAAVSGRAVGRMAGLTQSSAQRALTRLREDGLVRVEPAPPSLLYRANH
jgi:DNA-binding MarR family transcriptional regulator